VKPSAQALVYYGPKVLLVKRGPTAPWAPNLWGLPGGHIEPGETPAAAVVRELSEEVGIDWPYRLRYITHMDPDVHLFVVKRPVEYPYYVCLRDGEHTDFVWIRPIEALYYPRSQFPLAPGVSLALAVGMSYVGSAHRGA